METVALWGSGLQGEVEGCERATLVVPYRGRGEFRIGRSSLANLTGQTLLLVPPGPWRTYNDVLGGAIEPPGAVGRGGSLALGACDR